MADLTTELLTMKRRQLQKLCKKLGMKANGTEGVHSPRGTEASRYRVEEQSEEKTDPPRWCAVHGQAIVGPDQEWGRVTLKCCRPMVVAGDALVPFLLTPAAEEVPPHMEDNRICAECLRLNQLKISSLASPSTSQRHSGNSLLGSLCMTHPLPQNEMAQHVTRTKPPTLMLDVEDTGYSTSSSDSSSHGRLKQLFGQYYPQEDEGYAIKVEKLLLGIAKGDVSAAQAFGSGTPKVRHSPKC
ncbi:uncharacterized protein LOC119976471 isoform X2 [Scyliorhinus canicula]|uniref:uncharacterized protein LOC119976471 isoform X2 n=1 Tax=Scyliorhinus canicula TaxID=7830 RepID=UPI0018F67E17|nr:uncharacterized protein LOC119976471 isoform X2 [Scyliorhinus canicula]